MLQHKIFKKDDIADNIDRVMEGILNAKLENQTIPYYIDRTDLKLPLKRALLADTEKTSLTTRIVCGPRGSGKSTLVREVLQEEKGVVDLRIAGGTSEFASAVLQTLGLPCPAGIQPVQ